MALGIGDTGLSVSLHSLYTLGYRTLSSTSQKRLVPFEIIFILDVK